MSKRIEIPIGSRFGTLTVISKAPSRKMKSGGTVGYWNVRCDCGKEKKTQASHLLRRNKRTVCGVGCGFISTNPINVSCSTCGEAYIVQRRTLKTGNRRLCGKCISMKGAAAVRGKPAHNRLPNDEGAFKGLYTRYRLSAAERGVAFELSIEQFRNLTKDDCHFCGAPPSQLTPKSKKGNAPLYLYNGIDRLESPLGYHISNVVTCCGLCNRMKGDSTVDSFLERIAAIYRRHHDSTIDRAQASGRRTFMQ